MAAEAMTAAAPANGLMGCNEWAGYHWHSFGCHAHVDDPHPADAPVMAAMTMDAAAPTAGSTGCNEWAGYHEHSFGCHSHVDDPHTHTSE